MTEVTVIFFSCRRTGFLYQSIKAFIEINKYPISEFIIVNDSGDEDIHRQLRETYIGATFVFNKENEGLIRSVDLGYSHIKTDYFFHVEDDWCVTKPGFIEQSLTIMQERADIEEVWLVDYNNQPLEPRILKAGRVSYKLVALRLAERVERL